MVGGGGVGQSGSARHHLEAAGGHRDDPPVRHFTQRTAEPVAFLSHGGAAGGRHAALHPENVLTELPAVTVRDGLGFPNHFTASPHGRPLGPGAPTYARTVPDQLAWWAAALRSARGTAPI
ncbi:hypothetical protein ACFW2E_39300, partial [Streptomyces sp. NPDC058964]